MSFDRYGTKLELKGAFRQLCPAGKTTTMTWTADKNYYLDGAEYSDPPHNVKNRLWFEAHHPVSGLLERYVDGIYCIDRHFYEFYVAEVPAGVQLKCIYENNGTEDIEFSGNLHLHVDKE